MDHEQAFVHSFIAKSKQPRYLEKRASPKHRREFLSRLHHNLDYDPKLAVQVPPSEQTSALVYAKLRQLGASEFCYAIAAGADLDGCQLPLREALDNVLGMGNGVVLSCIPGKLAYYESEDPNGRYILSRISAA
jgi:hypothetical protein